MSKNLQNITISSSEIEQLQILQDSLLADMQAAYARYAGLSVFMGNISGHSKNKEAIDKLLVAFKTFDESCLKKIAA